MLFCATHLLRQAQGDVVVNHFGPAQKSKHSVTGRQLYTSLPLFGMHFISQRTRSRQLMCQHDQYTWPELGKAMPGSGVLAMALLTGVFIMSLS
jgi:hypothetical protein